MPEEEQGGQGTRDSVSRTAGEAEAGSPGGRAAGQPVTWAHEGRLHQPERDGKAPEEDPM